MESGISKRRFWKSCALGCCAVPQAVRSVVAQDVVVESDPEPHGRQDWIVDIHQHAWYLERTDAELLRHQKVMGVWKTILLPAGRSVMRESTHSGQSNGLDATVNGNRNAYELACRHPDHFVFFANEIPGLPDTRRVLEHWLRRGAVGIGEQKFNISVDSQAMKEIYAIAREFSVPVLMHFQQGAYNHDLLKFHHVLEEFQDVQFIGHAQTWWGNIDKNHDQKILYPPGPVAQGGVTDELLRNHGNLFADHSAGSGLNALLRDPDHTRDFLLRHQDQLLFGSDCPDKLGAGPSCHGTQILKTIRQYSPDPLITSKILSNNARRLFRI